MKCAAASTPTASPCGPTSCASRWVVSPKPQPMSSTRSPAAGGCRRSASSPWIARPVVRGAGSGRSDRTAARPRPRSPPRSRRRPSAVRGHGPTIRPPAGPSESEIETAPRHCCRDVALVGLIASAPAARVAALLEPVREPADEIVIAADSRGDDATLAATPRWRTASPIEHRLDERHLACCTPSAPGDWISASITTRSMRSPRGCRRRGRAVCSNRVAALADPDRARARRPAADLLQQPPRPHAGRCASASPHAHADPVEPSRVPRGAGLRPRRRSASRSAARAFHVVAPAPPRRRRRAASTSRRPAGALTSPGRGCCPRLMCRGRARARRRDVASLSTRRSYARIPPLRARRGRRLSRQLAARTLPAFARGETRSVLFPAPPRSPPALTPATHFAVATPAPSTAPTARVGFTRDVGPASDPLLLECGAAEPLSAHHLSTHPAPAPSQVGSPASPLRASPPRSASPRHRRGRDASVARGRRTSPHRSGLLA